jgi:hypothetical protein
MSGVIVVGSDATQFVQRFLTHHAQDASGESSSSSSMSFAMRTKYYSVTLQLRPVQLDPLVDENPFHLPTCLGFASVDQVKRACDALVLLVDAAQLLHSGEPVRLLDAFVQQCLLCSPSIVLCVDVCTELQPLQRVARDDAFREWLTEREIEYVTMRAVEDDEDVDPHDVFGFDRVRDVLAAHMWRDLKRHDNAPASRSGTGMEDDDNDDDDDDDDDEEQEMGEKEKEATIDEQVDEADVEQFEEALKAISAHRRTDDPAKQGEENEETPEQRQARLARAERMMATFLSGVGLKFGDL